MRLTLLSLILCLSAASAQASSVSLGGLKVGKTVVGPDQGTKELRGKCVLVVYWGTH